MAADNWVWCQGRLPARPEYSVCNLRGHAVAFPGEPYPVQVTYMEHMLRAFDEGENALLDAPTGIGKTRSLICAAMQWLNDTQRKENPDSRDFRLPDPPPRIWYDRPHFGLGVGSVVSNFFPKPAIVVKAVHRISGRHLTEEDWMERFVCEGTQSEVSGCVGDIHENPNAICPAGVNHEGTKTEPAVKPERSGSSSIVRTPANGGGTVLDMAAVLAKEESASFKPECPFTPPTRHQEGVVVKDSTDGKHDGAVDRGKGTDAAGDEKTEPLGKWLKVIGELKRTRYRPSTVVLASRKLYCINDAVRGRKHVNLLCQKLNESGGRGCCYRRNIDLEMERFEETWEIQDIEELVSSCRARELCPYYLAKERIKQADLVLTSGTLAPLSSFESELGTQFKVKLEAPHVVNMPKQVWAGACGCDATGNKIRCTFEGLKDPAMHDRIGRALIEWCAKIPDGVLVFFPSFRVLQLLVGRWQTKRVFSEARADSGDFAATVSNYYTAIDRGHGAIFFGVCRGKASEGINFADGYARGVVVIGIPYPSLMDSKIQVKQKFNEVGKHRGMGLCSGHEWYGQQAFKAVNQAMGRCIRHKDDFGAILLLDERYLLRVKRADISKWVSASIKAHNRLDAMLASTREFFEGDSELFVPPKGSLLPFNETNLSERKRSMPIKQEQNSQELSERKQGRSL